jgi:hypothetical protein
MSGASRDAHRIGCRWSSRTCASHLGAPFLSSRLLLHHERQHHGRCHTSVSSRARTSAGRVIQRGKTERVAVMVGQGLLARIRPRQRHGTSTRRDGAVPRSGFGRFATAAKNTSVRENGIVAHGVRNRTLDRTQGCRVAGHACVARKHQARIPFCTCSRFSASSNTTDCGPSITSSVTSSPRWAGKQCMKIASLPAMAISFALTW